jgi:N-methylhydantoinase A/oxoprolinase/acetone carboxylase beta subunit
MSYIIGIDVGGTNTNAALLEEENLVATAKCPTNHNDLISSTQTVLEEIIHSIKKPEDVSLHLSTTLTTNAIIEGRGEPAAAVIAPGPGVCLCDMEFPYPIFPVGGSIDHRGRETAPLELEQVRQVMEQIGQKGVRALAIVGKFAVRNPEHELAMEKLARKEFPDFSQVTLGHRMSGRLNFPRRVTTALLNVSIAHIQSDFAGMVRRIAHDYGIDEKVYLLKADGGTMRLEQSLACPIETVLSGPAASIMGALALGELDSHTSVTLDIGGTTTEISVLVEGEPLGERDGAMISGYCTLVPALLTRSIGLGGDSRIHWSEGKLQIGPERDGMPVCLGGTVLTPTDAVVALGEAGLGDRRRVMNELERFGQEIGFAPLTLAEKIIDAFCEKAIKSIRDVLDYLNRIPVYTVSEVLAPRDLKPGKIMGMGGPAGYFIPKIAAGLGLDYQVLPYAEAANAIGAAASHPTVAINLRADTALGKIVIPELDEITDIGRSMLFDGRQARKLALEKAAFYVEKTGTYPKLPEIEITDEEVFNVVRGFYTAGRIFSLKAQVKPGVKAVKYVVCGKKDI